MQSDEIRQIDAKDPLRLAAARAAAGGRAGQAGAWASDRGDAVARSRGREATSERVPTRVRLAFSWLHALQRTRSPRSRPRWPLDGPARCAERRPAGRSRHFCLNECGKYTRKIRKPGFFYLRAARDTLYYG